MKKLLVCAFALAANFAFADCCLGDRCPNTLAEYQDASGNPTGKYSLLDASGNKIQLKGVGDTCTCSGPIGTDWPPKNCTACQVVCPKCGHDIFQHTCDAKGTPGAGTKAIKQ